MPKFENISGPRLYQALAVRQGLKACSMGLRLNRAYTPTNCLRTATLFTGVKYGRGKVALEAAISDITKVIDEAHARGATTETVVGTDQQPWADPMPETPMPDHP